MVNATRVEYEKVVAKLVSEGKRRAYTVPYVVRALDPFEWDQRVSAPREEQEKRKKKLGLQVKDTVPYGPYPCNLKVEGVGWCQVTIMKESADLRYHYFGMQVALSVEVKSLRRDGKVQIWAQGEEYDPTDTKMKLQPKNEGWSFLMKADKVKEMIRSNRENWLKYNVTMLKYQ